MASCRPFVPVGIFKSRSAATTAIGQFKADGKQWVPVTHPSAKHPNGSPKYAMLRVA